MRVRHAEIFPLNVFVLFVNIFDQIIIVYLFKHTPSHQKFRSGAVRVRHAEIFPLRIVNIFVQLSKLQIYLIEL